MVALASTPKVSIIVPVYNAAATWRRASRRSSSRTTATSRSSSSTTARRTGRRDLRSPRGIRRTRVVVLHRENGGIAAAQNSGLDAATGELVTFCDNDDLMSVGMIGRLVEYPARGRRRHELLRWYNVGASTAASVGPAARRADRPRSSRSTGRGSTTSASSACCCASSRVASSTTSAKRTGESSTDGLCSTASGSPSTATRRTSRWRWTCISA